MSEYTPLQIASHIWFEADHWPDTVTELMDLIAAGVKFDRNLREESQ